MNFEMTAMLFGLTGSLNKRLTVTFPESVIIPPLVKHEGSYYVLYDYSQASAVAKYEEVGCMDFVIDSNCKLA